MTLEKKEFLKYSVLQVKEVNEVGFLKEYLKGGINSFINFWNFIQENFVK